MPVENPFAFHERHLDSPGVRHWVIPLSDTVDCDPRPRVVVPTTSGVIALRDAAGTVVNYPAVAGLPIPFSPTRVMVTGTTPGLSVIGWL